MKFKDAKEVIDTIRAGEEVRRVRSANRAKVDKAVNGEPYISPDEAKKVGVAINVNFGEMVVLAAHARRQYDQGILGSQHFFKVTIPTAPIESRSTWETFITNRINKVMKDSETYAYLKEYQFGAVVNHGIGPQLFDHSGHDWEPEFVAIDDLLIPTETNTSLKNLEWFGVRKCYTEAELSEKVFGENSVKGWNKKAVKLILDQYHNKTYDSGTYNWSDHPEKMADLIKQSGMYLSSDAAPSIPLVHFYHKTKKEGSRKSFWKLCVVPDSDCKGFTDGPQYIYDSDDSVADDVCQLLSIQFGDLNSRAPFKYHSVRSLGFLLFEPCFWMNLTRCRSLEHLIESFNVWLRSNDPSGKAKTQKVDLFNKAFLPEGISIVPNTERHRVEPGFIQMVMSNLKQLQAEASMAYTQDLDTGTKKEQTAFEVQTKLSQVNAILAGLLARAFRKETFAYREICRRFCNTKSDNDDVQEFLEDCKKEGIPAKFLDVKKWDVEPEIPMGSGNTTMAMAQAQQLMSVRSMHDPEAQREILHMFDEAITGDPKVAQRLAPVAPPKKITTAQEYAAYSFPTLMLGVPVPIRPELNLPDQIETLIGMLAGAVAQMTEHTSIPGIQTTAQFIATLAQQLGQDESQGPRVKDYMNSLKELMKEAEQKSKAFEEAKMGVDQETMAKVAAMQATTEAKIQGKMAADQQKLEIKQVQFEQEQARKDASVASDISRKNLQTEAQLAIDMEKTQSDLMRDTVKAEHEMKVDSAMTKHEMAMKKKKMSMEPKKKDPAK